MSLASASRGLVDGLEWSGTFHGIGARLLREHAGSSLGLDPGFTIHDREDSADLMNLGPRRARLLENDTSLPDQGHVPRDLLALHQRRGATGRDPSWVVSLVSSPGVTSCARFSRPTSMPSRPRTCSITTICCCTGRTPSPSRTIAADMGGCFDHVLVDEYQDTNRLQASILLALKAGRQRPRRGRRRRAVDLFLPRRRGPQHPRLPDALRPAGDRW